MRVFVLFSPFGEIRNQIRLAAVMDRSNNNIDLQGITTLVWKKTHRVSQ